MAKNDPLERVTYLRKDTQLLKDGIWYVTEVCPYHGTPDGLVDEEVSWEQAKTPHHAGVIAGMRHRACALSADAEQQRLHAREEIAAAERMLERQIANLEAARVRCRTAQAGDRKDPQYERRCVAAADEIKRHENGLIQAQRRLADVRRDNAFARKG